MRIIITGAAGFLGAHTVAHDLAAGHRVLALDRTPAAPSAAENVCADLLDAASLPALFAGADALLHLGNHSHAGRADARTVLAENTAMNANVFYAAVGVGVRRLVFASSIQAMSGGPLPPAFQYVRPPARRLPALPVDGDTPARAGNAYGLSKLFGEQLLAHLASLHGLQTVAIRFPWLAAPEQARERFRHPPDPRHHQSELYSWLPVEDAARLLLACLAAELPGFRIYQPTTPLPAAWPDAETLARTHLPDAPRRRPSEPLRCLVDTSRITRETGWEPATIG